MYNYKRLNDITGWALFLIALTVYVLTVEETASFWDCGEFIAVSYKLEVPHPPGAPFFLMVGRMFSFLAGGDTQQVAYWINMVSVVSSAFTILFLFWTTTLLARKLMNIKKGEEQNWQTISVIGAGVIAALAYTFSDSFWFSATEAEVYGMSSFFTAFVFWAILKWETIEDEKLANRWIILIAYMMGLSIGVHLLNLVTIPALGLIYYFKKRPQTTTWGIIATFLISGVILLIINYVIIPGLPSIAGSFEILFVNTFGLPFGSGIIFFALIFIGSVIYGLIYSQKVANEYLNLAMLGLTFILIGYGSYATIVIRSNFNPPIDENNPENIISVVSYLKREQYGSRPLLYGQYFTAEVVDQKKGAPIYRKGEDKYLISDYRMSYEFDPKQKTILPRAWSNSPQHAEIYRDYMNLQPGEVPSFADNIVFMVRHQIGHMYMRYFLWNFVGRDSDIQDAGVLTPWKAFEKVPSHLENNMARNNYWMLPLLLGLVGLIYQYLKDPKSFAAVALLFFLTGIALVLYLNSPPQEPRERDYIYAGSYYVFAIWIGFGMLALSRLFHNFISNKSTSAVLAIAISLSVPTVMAAEGWDDHDRSNRFFSVDSARNFLASCAPNAILFTGGDNDTFPLWYVQEVEGFRTDVRVIVLSYFNTDWYIEQMTKQVNKSEPLPISFTEEAYRQGGPNDYVVYREYPNIKGAIPLNTYLNLIKKNNQDLQIRSEFGSYNTVPSKTLYLNVDTSKVLSMGIIPENKRKHLVNRMDLNLKRNGIEKNTLMLLDIINTNNWERPIYFNNTSLQGIGIDVNPYVVQEGTAYRLLPVQNPDRNQEFVDTDLMLENMVENFYWRELNNPDVYYNEDYRNFVLNHRASFNTLCGALIREGQMEKARKAVLANLELMPDAGVPFDYTTAQTVDILFQVGETDTAVQTAQIIGDRALEMLQYYIDNKASDFYEVQRQWAILIGVSQSLNQYGQTELAQKYSEALRTYRDQIQYMNMRR